MLDGKELLSEVTDLMEWSEQLYQNFPEFSVQGHSGVVKWTVTREDWGPVPSSLDTLVLLMARPLKMTPQRERHEKGQDIKIWIPSAEIGVGLFGTG